ncbi:MAG: type VI secretion system tip protein VgrG [Gammaproteobacteria bacterium]
MADSPLLASDGAVEIKISSNGTALPVTAEIVSVDVESRVNRIGKATIVFNDGDMPTADFPLSNDALLIPGSEIKIEAGYNGAAQAIFTGVVVKHAIRVGAANASRLVIECKDKALAMTVGRKNACHLNKKDSDVITTLIGNHAGLTAEVTATTTQFKELVQYHCSDWDFMLARAEVNGMLVLLDAGKVSVKPPNGSASPVLTVTYGIDIMDFHAELDARAQYASVKAVSWDPATLKVEEQQAPSAALTNQGNITGATLAAVLGLDALRLQSNATLPTEALTAWAKAQQLKAELARIRGHVSFQGSSSVKVGDLIELKGVGDRFNGNVFVSGVTHALSDGNWVTRVDFGLNPDWFSEVTDLATPMASGLTSGIGGLQIGIVMKLDADPEGQHKVKVSLPLMGSGDQGVWARLAKFYGSSTFGAFFIPEIGDEVILGFINDDPSNPVILGSLYSSKNKPPYDLTSANNTKAVVTRSKMKLIFDEEKKKITLVTPANNTIVICDDTKSILIEDQTKNKIELNTSGITIDSPKDISIKAKGKITIDAVGNVAVSSNANITEDATNITHTAKVGFTAKGNATAEVSASGTTTIKGAMVLIN